MHNILKNGPSHGIENYLKKYIEKHRWINLKGGLIAEEKTGNRISDSVKFIEDVFCVDFEKGSYINCVYMIGSFYIGSTENLRARLMGHARSCIKFKHYNKEFQLKFMECLRLGVKMPVTVLSYDRREEKSIIERYSEIYDLCNVEFNPKKSN